MKTNKARKSSRLALFSETDRLYLKGKISKDRVGKSQFHSNLDKRFEALLEDLALLTKSSNLKSWRKTRAWKYHAEFHEANYFFYLFSDFDYGYSSLVRRISKGRGKSKKQLYWLDRRPMNNQRINERIFNKNYLFRAPRLNLTTQDKELFLKAYHNQGILPDKKEDAITLDEIKKRLSGKSKVRTNEKEISTLRDNFQDERNYQIAKVLERYRKKIDKVLAKYDSSIKKWDVHPDYHPE
jgi:hypothetical protein